MMNSSVAAVTASLEKTVEYMDAAFLQKLADIKVCENDACPCAGHKPRCDACEAKDCVPDECDCEVADCHWCSLYAQDPDACPCEEHKECGCSYFCNSDEKMKCDCLCHFLCQMLEVPDNACECKDIRDCYGKKDDGTMNESDLKCECECHEDDSEIYTENDDDDDDDDESDAAVSEAECDEDDDDDSDDMDIDDDDDFIVDDDDEVCEAFRPSECACDFCADMTRAQREFDEITSGPAPSHVASHIADVIRKIEDAERLHDDNDQF